MVIIDEQANNKLIHTLKSYTKADGRYAIRFHKIPQHEKELFECFINLMERHYPNGEIYLCDEEDIIVLERQGDFKQCRKSIYEAAILFGIEPVEKMGVLYDLSIETGALLILLEAKVEASRKIGEEIAARQAEAHALARKARKRQEMLEMPAIVRNLNEIRKSRSAPELMIIEDDIFSRRLVENVLAKEYSLTCLESAEDALLLYAKLAPDLLFLDINLPNVSGHELLEVIVAFDPDAYVVMLSGNADRENVMQAMRKGAKGFVAKPFNREKLFQYIERCTAPRREPV